MEVLEPPRIGCTKTLVVTPLLSISPAIFARSSKAFSLVSSGLLESGAFRAKFCIICFIWVGSKLARTFWDSQMGRFDASFSE